jgi:hypothetical protein
MRRRRRRRRRRRTPYIVVVGYQSFRAYVTSILML